MAADTRNRLRANFPPCPPKLRPKAIPSFSTKWILAHDSPKMPNSSPYTRCVLIQIFKAWSAINTRVMINTTKVCRFKLSVMYADFRTSPDAHQVSDGSEKSRWLGLFGFNGQRRMGYRNEALFSDELSGDTTDPVHFIFNPDFGVFQVL